MGECTAFVCPTGMLQSAPVGQKAAMPCGGTCGAFGKCAEDLHCEVPKTQFAMMFGTAPQGTCVSASGKAVFGTQATEIAKEALKLLNSQSNSMYLFSLSRVNGAEER